MTDWEVLFFKYFAMPILVVAAINFKMWFQEKQSEGDKKYFDEPKNKRKHIRFSLLTLAAYYLFWVVIIVVRKL